MNTVFIGLGSNLDEPLLQINRAVAFLKEIHDTTFISISNNYRSAPMGPQDQPDYINAVAKVATNLSAEDFLDELQKIENKQGRVRKQRWGARTLDLDILLYGDEVISTKRLTVPHIGIRERNFVLLPLNDLVDDDFEIPSVGRISELLAACPMTGIKRLTEV